MSRKKRQPGKRIEKRKILVLTEGKVTEPTYFCELCRHYKVPRGLVEIKKARNPQPKRMLNEITRIANTNNTLSNNKKEIRYDELWMVFDSEGKNIRHFTQIINSAKKLGIKVCISCPCFEIWLLLHFKYTNKPLSAKEAVQEIDVCMPGYKFTKKPDMKSLLPYVEVAIIRSEKLRQFCNNNDTFCTNTDCDDLVKLIISQGKR